MDDPVAPARAKTSRRTLLAGAAWSVPVIAAATAAPQIAASEHGNVPKDRLRIDDYRAENRNAIGNGRGPIHVFVAARYDQNIQHDADPAVASVPWTVTISGPLGTSVRTGTLAINKYGYAVNDFDYVDASTTSLPNGTYVFALTLYASDGVLEGSVSVTISA